MAHRRSMSRRPRAPRTRPLVVLEPAPKRVQRDERKRAEGRSEGQLLDRTRRRRVGSGRHVQCLREPASARRTRHVFAEAGCYGAPARGRCRRDRDAAQGGFRGTVIVVLHGHSVSADTVRNIRDCPERRCGPSRIPVAKVARRSVCDLRPKRRVGPTVIPPSRLWRVIAVATTMGIGAPVGQSVRFHPPASRATVSAAGGGPTSTSPETLTGSPHPRSARTRIRVTRVSRIL